MTDDRKVRDALNAIPEDQDAARRVVVALADKRTDDTLGWRWWAGGAVAGAAGFGGALAQGPVLVPTFLFLFGGL